MSFDVQVSKQADRKILLYMILRKLKRKYLKITKEKPEELERKTDICILSNNIKINGAVH